MKKITDVLNNSDLVSCEYKDKKINRKNVKNDLIVQHNDLIGARYRLNLQEKRVILWLLTQIKPDDEDFKLHKLKIAEFAKILNLKISGQYAELQEVTLNLMKKVLKIHRVETKSILQIAWLSYAEYYLTKGYVELRFDPALKPYLLQLKSHFTKLTLSDLMQLNSIYSVRFYELLKQYELIGQREISVKDFRTYCGIEDCEYKKYNDFKKNVLERAKKEINEKTDLKIDYAEIKESRKIVAIKWTIKKRNIESEQHLHKVAILQKELRSAQILIESLMEYGISRQMAKQLIKNHGEEVVKDSIRVVNLQIERNNAKNPKALLLSSIKNGWHPEKFVAHSK